MDNLIDELPVEKRHPSKLIIICRIKLTGDCGKTGPEWIRCDQSVVFASHSHCFEFHAVLDNYSNGIWLEITLPLVFENI